MDLQSHFLPISWLRHVSVLSAGELAHNGVLTVYKWIMAGLCLPSCVEEKRREKCFCSAAHHLLHAGSFLTWTVNSAGKKMGFQCGRLVTAVLWVPLFDVTHRELDGGRRRTLRWSGAASRHKRRREQSVKLQEVFSHLGVKWLPANWNSVSGAQGSEMKNKTCLGWWSVLPSKMLWWSLKLLPRIAHFRVAPCQKTSLWIKRSSRSFYSV